MRRCPTNFLCKIVYEYDRVGGFQNGLLEVVLSPLLNLISLVSLFQVVNEHKGGFY